MDKNLIPHTIEAQNTLLTPQEQDFYLRKIFVDRTPDSAFLYP